MLNEDINFDFFDDTNDDNNRLIVDDETMEYVNGIDIHKLNTEYIMDRDKLLFMSDEETVVQEDNEDYQQIPLMIASSSSDPPLKKKRKVITNINCELDEVGDNDENTPSSIPETPSTPGDLEEENTDPRRSSQITEADKLKIGDFRYWRVNDVLDENDNILQIGKRIYGNRDKLFSMYDDRKACSASKTHTPIQQGINGNRDTPAESIVAMAMGGYEDEDFGKVFIYTGQGGTDTKDQEMNTYNTSLTLNMERKIPVRLIRGYQLDSKYSPDQGYRYDGLYWVTDYWLEPKILKNGLEGAKVYKYRLVRLEGQDPIPERSNYQPKVAKRPTRDEYLNRGMTGFVGSPSIGKHRRRNTSATTTQLNSDELGTSETSTNHGDSFISPPIKNNISYNYFRTRDFVFTPFTKQYGILPSFTPKTVIGHKEGLHHWHSSSSELVEIPALTKNHCDGVYAKGLEETLKNIYKKGFVIGQDEHQLNKKKMEMKKESNTSASTTAVVDDNNSCSVSTIPEQEEETKYVFHQYKVNDNGLLELSIMNSHLKVSHFSRFIQGGVAQKKLSQETDFERVLSDKCTQLEEELNEQNMRILNERKENNVKRIRDIIKKI
ncbi:hypothetical protein ABK040_013990 [Willaertia magna]